MAPKLRPRQLPMHGLDTDVTSSAQPFVPKNILELRAIQLELDQLQAQDDERRLAEARAKKRPIGAREKRLPLWRDKQSSNATPESVLATLEEPTTTPSAASMQVLCDTSTFAPTVAPKSQIGFASDGIRWKEIVAEKKRKLLPSQIRFEKNVAPDGSDLPWPWQKHWDVGYKIFFYC